MFILQRYDRVPYVKAISLPETCPRDDHLHHISCDSVARNHYFFHYSVNALFDVTSRLYEYVGDVGDYLSVGAQIGNLNTT